MTKEQALQLASLIDSESDEAKRKREVIRREDNIAELALYIMKKEKGEGFKSDLPLNMVSNEKADLSSKYFKICLTKSGEIRFRLFIGV